MSIYYRQRNIVNLFSFDTFANIFGRVARNDILQCILTCRQWRHVVPHYASSCFRHLVLEGKQDPMEYSILLEQVCGYAKVVVLDQCSFFLSRSGLPVAMPYFFSNVTTLHLKRGFIYQDFGRMLQTMPLLSHITITSPTSIPLSSAFISYILHCCPRMVSIIIAGVTESAHQTTTTTSSLRLPVLPPPLSSVNLQHLDLSGYPIYGTDLYHMLKECPDLKSLAVANVSKVGIFKAILSVWCPAIRHLYYRGVNDQELMPAYHDEDEDDQQTSMDGICLRKLSIDVTDARHFADQNQITNLHLHHYHHFQSSADMDMSYFADVKNLFKNNTDALTDLSISFGTDMLALSMVIPLFKYMSNVTSLRLSVNYNECVHYTTLATLNILHDEVSQHATISSIALAISPPSNQHSITIDCEKFMTAVANISYLKRVQFLSCNVNCNLFKRFFSKATDLESVTLSSGTLQISNEMFRALAGLRLDSLELISTSKKWSTLGANGFRYFIDHHAGPLNTMTIKANVLEDQCRTTMEYAHHKLGKRLKYQQV